MKFYPKEKISNHDVYGWKIFQREEVLFVPYSQRNEKDIKEKKIVLSINKKARKQIYEFLERCNMKYQATDDTGWNYWTSIATDVFTDIKQFYVPKSFNSQKEYVETDSLEDFIISTLPFCVLHAIELFARHSTLDNFEDKINTILKLNNVTFQLSNGKIVNSFDFQITKNSLGKVREAGLKELFQESSIYYDIVSYTQTYKVNYLQYTNSAYRNSRNFI